MSNALIGGLAQGIASGKQNAQNMRMQQEQQAMMQEYYKLQQEQIKQRAKLEETKLKQMEFENTFKLGLLQRMGFSGHQAPAPAPAASVGPAPSAGQFGPLAKYAEEYYGLPQGIVAKMIGAESTGDPMAVSPKGAQGLMQLMPGTARDLGVSNPFDPQQNVMGGSQYLRQMLDRFGGNVELALAAYNAGPEAVAKHGGVPPYKETQDYVRKLTGGGGGDLPGQIAKAQMGNDLLNDPMGVALLNMAMGGNFNYDPGRISFQDTVGPNNEPITMGFNTITGKPIPGLVLKKPVQYDRITQTAPGGEENTYFFNKANPPPGVTTKASGVGAELVGRSNMIFQAYDRMDEIGKILFDDKNGINRELVFQSSLPFGGIGAGRMLNSKIRQALNAALRLETGAAAHPGEVDEKFRQYSPLLMDNDETIRQKFKDLKEYIHGVVNLNDPTGELRKMRNADRSKAHTLDLKAGRDAGAKSPEAEADAWLKGQ